MIESSVLEQLNFAENYSELEEQFVSELENMILSQLIENGRVTSQAKGEDVIEFAGRTNFKIRVKRPNKNVWSIPIQLLKEAIRKVLREGKLLTTGGSYAVSKTGKPSHLETPLKLLLASVPEEEYRKRSLVGNLVTHEVYGEGIIRRITNTGNVEIEFENKVALLKPGFFELKK